MSDSFQIQFKNAHIAQAIKFSRRDQLRSALASLNFATQQQSQRPVLVLVGGASGMTPEYLDRLFAFFTDVICPLLEAHQGVVIDGGTDAGIMSLMGKSRQKTGSTFPLIGVAAQGTVCLPQQSPPANFADFALLEPHHTHFVLVPGTLWGDESPWIAEVANVLASHKSLTLLVNGGKISWQDVSYSVRAQRPVLVLAGSGRTADELALAIEGDRSNQRANQLVDSGLLACLQLQTDLDPLKQEIDRYLR
ncbi:MAG: hypothetical protein ACO3NK_00370 [Prochlorotrichaceae cyanobacterium]|jgi:hypothetical protein